MKTEYKTSTLGWKRERERKEERKRKGGGERKGRKRSSTEGEEKRHEFHRHDDILSDSMWIGPANEIVLVVLIAYANRRPLICRKTSESPDSVGAPLVSCKFLRKVRKNQLGWLVGCSLHGSCFRERSRTYGIKMNRAYRRYTCCAVAYWNGHVLSAHVRQLSKRETIVSSPRWLRFASSHYHQGKKTHGRRMEVKKISSPIFESIEHNLDKEERNIIRFFSLLTEID